MSLQTSVARVCGHSVDHHGDGTRGVSSMAVGGSFNPHPLEVADLGWFTEDSLPVPLVGMERWGDTVFAAARGEHRENEDSGHRGNSLQRRCVGVVGRAELEWHRPP